MSKPKHYRRGKGRYVGYGFMSTDLNAKKGSLTYRQNLKSAISGLPPRVCPDHYDKLCRYLSRVM